MSSTINVEKSFDDNLNKVWRNDNNVNKMSETILKDLFSTKEKCNNKDVIEKLDRIEKKLDLIFGSHVLIDGKWIDVNKLL